MRKQKCTKGTACSYSCISGKLQCSDKVQKRNADALLSAAAASPKPGYDSWQSIAKGNFGEVKLSPDGQRVAKLALKPDAFGQYEVELATKMHKLGHSPAIYSSSAKHIEMGLAKGATLWAGYMPAKDQPGANAGQASAIAAALTDLHRPRYSHGDAHSLQFMFDGDKLSLLDYGLSKPALDSPRTLLQDLTKSPG